MAMEIHVLDKVRHKDVAGLNSLMFVYFNIIFEVFKTSV